MSCIHFFQKARRVLGPAHPPAGCFKWIIITNSRVVFFYYFPLQCCVCKAYTNNRENWLTALGKQWNSAKYCQAHRATPGNKQLFLVTVCYNRSLKDSNRCGIFEARWYPQRRWCWTSGWKVECKCCFYFTLTDVVHWKFQTRRRWCRLQKIFLWKRQLSSAPFPGWEL